MDLIHGLELRAAQTSARSPSNVWWCSRSIGREPDKEFVFRDYAV